MGEEQNTGTQETAARAADGGARPLVRAIPAVDGGATAHALPVANPPRTSGPRPARAPSAPPAAQAPAPAPAPAPAASSSPVRVRTIEPGGVGTSPAAVTSPEPVETPAIELRDDEPILIVESFPAEGSLFDRPPVPLHARTFHMRYDTAAVGGFVAAILMTVAFMLGRTGSTPAEAQGAARAPEIARDSAPIAPAPAAELASPRIAAMIGGEAFEEPGPAPAARPATPAPAREEPARAAPPPPPPAPAATIEARWGIMAIGGIPQRSATEVARFLEEKGFKATVIGSGENYGVIVGGYAERRGGPIDADLTAVRALTYKDGKKAFAGAYASPLRKAAR